MQWPPLGRIQPQPARAGGQPLAAAFRGMSILRAP
jgi:hypothetical protein